MTQAWAIDYVHEKMHILTVINALADECIDG